MYPDLGCPLTFYKECFIPNDEGCKKAQKSAKKLKKSADEARQNADEEFVNKRRCLAFEKEHRKWETSVSSFTTAARPKISEKDAARLAIMVGDYVKVEPDLSPGKCSFGGTGWIVATTGTGGDLFATVEYDEGMTNKKETNVPLDRLTVVPAPVHGLKRKRATKVPAILNMAPCVPSVKPKPKGIENILKDGASRNRAKGWRAADLCVKKKSEGFDDAYRRDAFELKAFLRGSAQNNKHMDKSSRSGKFKARANKHNPLTLKYLAHAWGVSKMYLNRLEEKAVSEPVARKENPTRESPIESYEAAKLHHSAKNIFLRARVDEREAKEQTLQFEKKERSWQRYVFYEEAKAEWVLMSDEDKEYWHAQERARVAEQPYVQDRIIEALRSNASLSYEKIAGDIGEWCSASAIQRFLAKHETYSTYVGRILPLLTTEQRKKQVVFSKHLGNNWGLPRGKYLWVHYDEKWFHGLVVRAMAKRCEELGLDKQMNAAYHKNHIDKVMAVAFTAYAFDSNIENGGHGLKLGLYRVQGARVAKKMVRKSRRTADGRLKMDGDIVRRKGDVYMIDCNVTGSNSGTSDKPKFSLQSLFEDVIWDVIDELIMPGGPYEGYIPVIQGDNAGPHQDAEFIEYCKNYCALRGWYWEPQAPQMPYVNNLDLAVFPAMSHAHSDLLAKYSNTVAPPDEIWRTAQQVWQELASATIARGFVLASRIAKKVVEHKGDNAFLGSKEFHCNVRNDFYETAMGIKRRVAVVE